jgi:hypothetical protein
MTYFVALERVTTYEAPSLKLARGRYHLLSFTCFLNIFNCHVMIYGAAVFIFAQLVVGYYNPPIPKLFAFWVK